jgi:hypothetical protein
MPERSDDPSLDNDAILLRRIWNQPAWITAKALRQGRLEPSSAAFLDDLDEVSVFVSPPKNAEELLVGYEAFGVVAIRAGVPRSLGHIVAITPEEEDPSHRAICPGSSNLSIGRKSAAKQMAASSEWVVLTEYYRDRENQTGLSINFLDLNQVGQTVSPDAGLS